MFISHGAGDAPVTLLADLKELCQRIVDRTDEKVPFTFLGLDGLLARTRYEGIEDGRANIAYREDRIH